MNWAVTSVYPRLLEEILKDREKETETCVLQFCFTDLCYRPDRGHQ
jgi:hypothetical protein